MTYEDVKELFTVLNVISAEFQSDPQSVQYFDLRIVERAKAITDKVRPLIRGEVINIDLTVARSVASRAHVYADCPVCCFKFFVLKSTPPIAEVRCQFKGCSQYGRLFVLNVLTGELQPSANT